MAKQVQSLFLEEWLRSNSGSSTSTNSVSSRQFSSASARSIIQSWADLRDSLHNQSFQSHHLQSLKTLLNSQLSLYVADPQAKLLISILSSPYLSLPQESYPLLLRLLYIWVRKSSKPSLLIIDSAAEVLSHLFFVKLDSIKSSLLVSEGILLLGALSFGPSISDKSKIICLELLCMLLEKEYSWITSSELIPSVLAGIGYALSSSQNVCLVRILDSLLGVWVKEDGPAGSVFHGLMILHLIEWVLSNFMNSNSAEEINLLSKQILETRKPTHASFAVVMAAAGIMRASSKSVRNGLMELRISAEQKIDFMAGEFISKTSDSLLLQCISLAFARNNPVSFRPSLFNCLASALLTEVFPLKSFYARFLDYTHEKLSQPGLFVVKKHLDSVIFKEAGAITRVFCNQYVLADERGKSMVENLVWKYCQDVYSWHRLVALMLRGNEDELLGVIEKIAESAFLMVVVFSLGVTKHRLEPRFNQETQFKVSVKVLVSLSCMEYFRRMRLPEYMDTIRGVVVSVQENEAACVSFVESMPCYNDLTNRNGSLSLKKAEYNWSKDEVQTARTLFYLRVIPTCIERLPPFVFRKVVAPTMFLYLGHPNGKVARAAHSMFSAFISSGKDLNQEDERDALKEQLVFYYVERSLERYPGITPFEGMASGVVALVRHLPAGSPPIFYCIHSVAEKANSLCNGVSSQETDQWKDWKGELEPCKKVFELLIRLLTLVDIQVLPSLMKLLAQLTVQLPKEGQNLVLNELHVQVAESDDVTRKPTLVSWLQSLSYLCSKQTTRRASARNVGTLSWNGVNARL